MEVSQKSQAFLENLRLYLVSSGKKEQEIESLIEELESHLYEAEKHGKDVNDIIGKTPKQYMEDLSREMEMDVRWLLKYIPIIVLGAFSYILMGDAIRGGISYSVIQIIGYLFTFAIFLLILPVSFKSIATTSSKVKIWTLTSLVGITPTLLFVTVLLLDRNFETPVIEFGAWGNIAAWILSGGTFIGLAIMCKSLHPIILPLVIFLPEYLIQQTNLPEKTQVFVSLIVYGVCVTLYLLLLWRKTKRVSQMVS